MIMLDKIVGQLRSVFDKVGKKTEKKEIPNNLDQRVIKLVYPPSKYKAIDEQTKHEMWKGRYAETASSQILRNERFNFIIKDIRQRFAGKTIGLRGILTSLEGDVQVKEGNGQITVFDITKLLMDGTEKVGARGINIADAGMAEKLNELPPRVEQFFLSCVRNDLVGEKENFQHRDRLFPAIIVYDISADSPLGKLEDKRVGYYHELPTNSVERSQVILGVYPVDVRFLLPDIKK